jgi:glycerol-3-phosphate cytidylyltransferase
MIRGFTCSSFDLFHAGHVSMLREAKEQCDYLYVFLQTDPTVDRPEKNKPVQSIHERFIQVDACTHVDEVIPYTTEEDLLDLINLINPNIRIIGEEYKEAEYTGKELPIEVYYNSRKHTQSSSSLRERVVSTWKKS